MIVRTSRLISAAANASCSNDRRFGSMARIWSAGAEKRAGNCQNEVAEDVDDEEEDREAKLLPDEAVGGQAFDQQRRGESRDAHDQVPWDSDPSASARVSRRYAMPFLNSSSSARSILTGTLVRLVPPVALRSLPSPRAPAAADACWFDAWLPPESRLPSPKPRFLFFLLLLLSFLRVFAGSALLPSPPDRPRAPASSAIAMSAKRL